MSIAPPERIYDIIRHLPAGPHQGRLPVKARIKCSRCQNIHEITLNNDLPPEYAIKRLSSTGWKLKGRTAWRCPECQAKGETMTTVKSAPPLVNGAAAQSVRREPETAPAPTTVQVVAIVNALEAYFDREKGAYTDGQSDKKIADQVDVGWAHVAKIREEAYGALRINPEVEAIRIEIDKVSTRLEDFRRNAVAEMERMASSITTLQARARKLEAAHAA